MNVNMIEHLFYRLVYLDNLNKYKLDMSFIFRKTARLIMEKKQKDFNNQIIICVNDFLSGKISISYPSVKCYILIESNPSHYTHKGLVDNNIAYNIWLEDENGNYLLGTL